MGFTAPSGWNIWKMRFEKQSEGESDMKYYSTRDAAVRMDAAEAVSYTHLTLPTSDLV
mgnify:CR=1 FL=1